MSVPEEEERRPLLSSGPEAGRRDELSATNPADPINWRPGFKWTIVALIACMAFTVTFTCTSLVPIASLIEHDLDPTTNGTSSARILLVTIWELGEAAGPLVMAPLSESVGRSPVLNGANLLFVLAISLAALSSTMAHLVLSRFLSGLAVASNVLGPAVIGDIFPAERRGAAMSVLMSTPLIGGAIGPAIGGTLAQSLGAGWRAVLWMSAAFAGTVGGLFWLLFRETYGLPPSVSSEAARRRHEEEGRRRDDAMVVEAARLLCGEEDGLVVRQQADETKTDHQSVGGLGSAIMRPAVMLFGSGVLMALSVFGSVVFSWFYVIAVTFPDFLECLYGLSPASAGAAFISFSVGSFVSVVVCNQALDAIYTRLRRESGDGVDRPEYRLPLCVAGAFLLPASGAAYGWAVELRLPLPLLLVAVAMIGVSCLLVMIPLMGYVVDAFGRYSASAITGLIVMRCLAGTFLPLVVGPLVERLGPGRGLTVFAALALALAPVPILVMRHGKTWRQRSAYTRVGGPE